MQIAEVDYLVYFKKFLLRPIGLYYKNDKEKSDKEKESSKEKENDKEENDKEKEEKIKLFFPRRKSVGVLS